MSTFKVTVEKLVVEPHPNADRLELAQVGLYRAVVPKGEYRTGDYAVYIPEQAVLPPELIEELGLTGKLAGKDANRVKAVRLRGAVSQGVVCRPKALGTEPEDWAVGPAPGLDYAVALGITKWTPEIPAHMSGKVIPAPELIRWPDIENLKRYPDIFSPGEQVVATEKIHGTCCLVTYVKDGGQVFVSSKGFGERNLALEEDTTNLYWRAVISYELGAALVDIAEDHAYSAVALFGEVYGQGVQDLHYGKAAGRNETLGFVAFDIAAVDSAGKHWLDADVFDDFATQYDIPTAPVLHVGPFDLEKLTEIASGPTVLGSGAHIREGIVIRPITEQHSDVTGGRKIAKLVSDAYLLRKGGTEFE